MEGKNIAYANLNLVFGSEESPLLEYLDEIVIPALQGEYIRQSTEKTYYMFDNVNLTKFKDGDLAITGILIKDTVLDVMTKYHKEKGLEKTNLHYQSSPYSAFIIYLKNHKMVLIKNQSGSPDIRAFAATFRDVLVQYRRKENKRRRENKLEYLPSAILNVTGIKTDKSVRDALKGVEKVNELILKFKPLNAEWDRQQIFGGIEKEVRKVINADVGRMVFKSPKNINGVIEVLESTQGLVDAELVVTRENYESVSGGKKKEKIRDDEIMATGVVDISGQLDESFEEIHNSVKDVSSLHSTTPNNLIDFNKYKNKHNK